jgi:hypothetical protein
VAWPDAPVTAYRRPLGKMGDSLAAAGFRVEMFDEPKPRDEYEEHAPERYERALERPEVLCIRVQAVPSG